MFVKKSIQPHVKDIETSRNKLGKGNFANKGACSVRFRYKDSTLAFACCHLESGRSTELEQKRRHQMGKIMKKAFV